MVAGPEWVKGLGGRSEIEVAVGGAGQVRDGREGEVVAEKSVAVSREDGDRPKAGGRVGMCSRQWETLTQIESS